MQVVPPMVIVSVVYLINIVCLIDPVRNILPPVRT